MRLILCAGQESRYKPREAPSPERVIALFRSGLDTAQIARRYWVDEAVIYNRLAQAKDRA